MLCFNHLHPVGKLIFSFGSQPLRTKWVRPIWRETSLSSGTFHPLPSCAAVERRLRAAPVVARWQSRCGGCGLRQAGCVSACPAAGGPHLLCADKSAGSVGHVKCLRRCPPGRDGQTSWCSAPVFRGQRRKRGNAAASGTVLKRELSHRKSDFRFARFRRASSMIRKEITARSARMPHNPFHGRGRAFKGRSCSFLGLGRGNVDSPCRRSRLANENAPSPSCDRCPSISEV